MCVNYLTFVFFNVLALYNNCFVISDKISDNLTEFNAAIFNTSSGDIIADGSTISKRSRIMTGQPSSRNLANQQVELRTSMGTALGVIEFSEGLVSPSVSNGRRFYAFRGIPYARPPTGSLRWQDPIDHVGFWPENRLDATQFQAFCPQYSTDTRTVIGDEDCLYLNVYSPNLASMSPSPLPVLVFIHGGAYIRGSSSSHGPDRLMREDIVLVTINYRLGILGFLSSNDHEIAGNYGLLDQVSALRWVKRHISEFGGDPNAVTIGGFSAGASMVHLHLMSPVSQGLFNKAIIMSGAGNCLWSVQEYPWEEMQKVGDYLGCSSSSSSYMKQCLLLKDKDTLIRAQSDMHRYVYWPFRFRPVVDYGMRNNPFLPSSVHDIMSRPLPSSVPVMIGGTPEEGILFALTLFMFNGGNSSPAGVFDGAFPYIFSSLWQNETNNFRIAQTIMSFYFSKNARTDRNILLAEATEAITDLLFTDCIWDAASNLGNSKSPVYTYLMTHHEPTSPTYGSALYSLGQAEGLSSPLLRHGVSHGDDMALLFSFSHLNNQLSITDKQMSHILTSIWGSFVKTGSPQDGSTISSTLPTWTPLLPGESVNYYRLSLNPAPIDIPFRYKERNFWKQTLVNLENTFEEVSVSNSWQAATWSLFALIILLILLILVLVFLIRNSKRSKNLSHLPRLSAMRSTR